MRLAQERPGEVAAGPVAAPIVAPLPGPPWDDAILYRRGVVLVLVATFFWSLSGLFVRLMHEAGGWQIIFWRALALSLTMLVVMALRCRGQILAVLRDAGWVALAAGTLSGTAGMLHILALGHTTVANVLFMTGISPFVAALVARWLLGEPVSRTTWTSMTIGAVGIAVMVGGAFALGRVLGNVLALGTAVCFALFGVMLRRGRRADMMAAVLAAGSVTTLASGIVLIAEGDRWWSAFEIPAHDFLLCVFLGAVQQGVGTTCFTLGARYVPAAHLQLFAMNEMLMAPLWAWLVVAEAAAPTTLLGGALIVSALGYQAVLGLGRTACR
jgi:drug/metabolite transporter (DMT)-like permease